MTDDQPSLFTRFIRRTGILAGTALIAGVAFGGIHLATKVIAANSVRIDVQHGTEPLSVTVHPAILQDSYQIAQEFIGRVEPRQDSTLGFENGGTIAGLLVDDGDLVARGDVLAFLDMRGIEAQLAQQRAARAALAAQLELAQLTSERQKTLADRSFSSQQRADEARLGVAELEARLAESDAVIAQSEIQLDKSYLRAPFDARVAARHVDEGARVAASAPVIELQEQAAPQVRIGLLPGTAAALTIGDKFDVQIGGQPYVAHFVSRRGEIDPVTRTLPVLFDLEATGNGAPLPFGAVVRLRVLRDIPEHGVWLPVTALSEGPRGLWTVLVIDDTADTPRVAMEAVEVIHADEARAYVRGALSDGTQVLSDGAHRVAVGQNVRIATGG